MSRKLTLKESEWFWALNRGKLIEYYRKNYIYTSSDLSEEQHHLFIGQIVGHLLYVNSIIAMKVLQNIQLDWNLNVSEAFNYNIVDSYKVALTKNGLCWLLFNSLRAELSRKNYDEIFEGDWRQRWDELDNEYLDLETSETE